VRTKLAKGWDTCTGAKSADYEQLTWNANRKGGKTQDLLNTGNRKVKNFAKDIPGNRIAPHFL